MLLVFQGVKCVIATSNSLPSIKLTNRPRKWSSKHLFFRGYVRFRKICFLVYLLSSNPIYIPFVLFRLPGPMQPKMIASVWMAQAPEPANMILVCKEKLLNHHPTPHPHYRLHMGTFHWMGVGGCSCLSMMIYHQTTQAKIANACEKNMAHDVLQYSKIWSATNAWDQSVRLPFAFRHSNTKSLGIPPGRSF